MFIARTVLIARENGQRPGRPSYPLVPGGSLARKSRTLSGAASRRYREGLRADLPAPAPSRPRPKVPGESPLGAAPPIRLVTLTEGAGRIHAVYAVRRMNSRPLRTARHPRHLVLSQSEDQNGGHFQPHRAPGPRPAHTPGHPSPRRRGTGPDPQIATRTRAPAVNKLARHHHRVQLEPALPPKQARGTRGGDTPGTQLTRADPPTTQQRRGNAQERHQARPGQ